MHSQQKRARIGDMAPSTAAGLVQPSSVVLVSDLKANTTEQDILDDMRQYGSVLSVAMLPPNGQALVEFEQLRDAKALVENYLSGWPARIRDMPVSLSYSRPGELIYSSEYASASPSSTLLLTVFRSSGELACDIFKRVGSQFGRLVRVAVLRGRNLQVVLEFASLEEAVRTKRNINGADIYPDCNTLLCEFASRRVQDMLIREGSSLIEEWRQGGVGGGGSLLEPVGGGGNVRQELPHRLDSQQRFQEREPRAYPQEREHRDLNARAYQHQARSQEATLPVNPTSPGCLLYITGLPDNFNCDRLFNLLCLYGNVKVVRFFAGKRGQAMAEMLDPQSAMRCVTFLNNECLLGGRLSVSLSHQTSLRPVREVTQLSDGTQAMVNYASNSAGFRTLNRFLSDKVARKTPPVKPSRTVYFWGHPSQGSEELLRSMLSEAGAPEPPKRLADGNLGIEYFPGDHRSGLLRYETSEEALTAIALANHIKFPLQEGDNRRWMLKLCFSVTAGFRQQSRHGGEKSSAGGGGGGDGRSDKSEDNNDDELMAA